MFRLDSHLPVDVRGTLRLSAPTGGMLNLVADGATLRLELPGWKEARAMIPRSFAARAKTTRNLAGVLTTAGLTLQFEFAGTPICHIGRDIRPSWFARLLGLAPARVPLSAIWLLFKR